MSTFKVDARISIAVNLQNYSISYLKRTNFLRRKPIFDLQQM